MAACSGFMFSLATATAFMRSGMYRNVLVIGVELLSRFLDYTDRNTCVLFGDGAGAVIVSASDAPGGLMGLDMYSDGSGKEGIIFPAGGSACPTTPKTIAEGGHFVHMAGKEVYKYATRQLAESRRRRCASAGLTVDDVDQFLFHQANLRIIESVQNAVGIPADKTYLNIEQYGNTWAASVPMALVEAIAEDRIKPGDRLLMAAFGAGYTAGAAVVEWTADPALHASRPGRRRRHGPAAARACRGRGVDVRPHRQDGARHRRQPRPGPGDRARLRRPGRRRRDQLPRQRRGGRRGRGGDHRHSGGARSRSRATRARAARRARRS